MTLIWSMLWIVIERVGDGRLVSMQERNIWEAAFNRRYIAPVFQVISWQTESLCGCNRGVTYSGNADQDDRLVTGSHERPEAW